MAEPLTDEEQHRQICKAAEDLIEEYDSYVISTSLIVLQRQVDILRAALRQSLPNTHWAIYSPANERVSGWYLQRANALASMPEWERHYRLGYRCRRVRVEVCK